MRIRLLFPAAVALSALFAFSGTASAAPRYYVSIGDSLAASYQPNAAAPGSPGLITNEGYSEQLLATARKRIKGLELRKYGCPGESTATMITGNCKGAVSASMRSSQLRRAERFLRRNRRKVAFVTYSMGANDLLPCVGAGYTVDTFCIAAALQTFEANSRTINRRLRAAAGPKVKIAQLLYYNPFVALFAQGSEYSSTAQLSDTLLKQVNRLIRAEGKRRRFRYADAFKAFESGNLTTRTTLPGLPFEVPVATAKVCTLTWMCTGHRDIHANKTGYGVLAAELKKALKL